MQTILTVLGAIALAAAGWWWWTMQPHPQPQPTNPVAQQAAHAPEVVAVEFPKTIAADGEPVGGVVRFRAPDAALTYASFTVESASFFTPFGFDPEVGEVREGTFEFYLATVVPQTITLRVTLTDAQGRTSAPQAFTFRAEMVQENQGL